MKNKLDMMFQNDFIRLPRPFIRRFNLNTAVMLSEIYSEYTYWKEHNELQKGGWFFSTVENMYNNAGLSKHQQLVACKELKNYGIIDVKYHGMPQKRYFKFNTKTFDRLYEDFNQNTAISKGIGDDNDEDVICADSTPKRLFTGFSF